MWRPHGYQNCGSFSGYPNDYSTRGAYYNRGANNGYSTRGSYVPNSGYASNRGGVNRSRSGERTICNNCNFAHTDRVTCPAAYLICHECGEVGHKASKHQRTQFSQNWWYTPAGRFNKLVQNSKFQNFRVAGGDQFRDNSNSFASSCKTNCSQQNVKHPQTFISTLNSANDLNSRRNLKKDSDKSSYLRIKVNGVYTTVLCDSGSVLAICSEKFFRKISTKIEPLENGLNFLLTANGSKMPLRRKNWFTVGFWWVWMTHTFLVASKSTTEIIIGVNFLPDHKMSLNCAENVMVSQN